MITCHSVSNVWPKTTLLLPVWPEMPKGWTLLCLQAAYTYIKYNNKFNLKIACILVLDQKKKNLYGASITLHFNQV